MATLITEIIRHAFDVMNGSQYTRTLHETNVAYASFNARNNNGPRQAYDLDLTATEIQCEDDCNAKHLRIASRSTP